MFTSIRSAAGVAVLLVAAAIGLAGIARADGQMYGDPEAAATYWRYQHQEDCGLMAIADVVGQLTGHEPTQVGIELRGIFTPSESHGGDVYFFDGTSPEDMVMLLRKYGIQSDLTTGNSMGTIEDDLSGGHKVIAALNAETIWNYPPGQGQRTQADHAVVVTGVDTGTNIVHLNDSGTPNGRDERIPLDTFTQAWSTSDNLLIVTQQTGYGTVAWAPQI
ncbi:C39 family peptidase [Candidatus Mycobacterium methanotrophicum]|uniref:C39 family peptidase n=1 Tax=Candidatus Mycobacterium methanotrophicum TaxID=2943498 RepID=A0ABY4QMN4_9MYCO|nr:C39 family peptidase [Candidatus Mycobacterium methanotrophicum]UQX12238.1 C39 family peptidase [Candidatus Mycobacterium methanotrophicum]